MSTTLDAAVALTAEGYPVFPCYPRGSGVDADGITLDKRPLVSGWRTLTTGDTGRIHSWWTQWPGALIAVPTGGVTGLWVVDVDIRPDEDKNGFQSLAAAGLVLPPTRAHHTSRGGAHLLYRAPPGAYCVTNNNTVGPGVDLKGDGGYIIWWPAHGGAVTEGAFAEPPSWMMRYTGRDRIGDGEAKPPMGLDDDAIDELMGMIPPASMGDRGPWIRLGMALHHETNGDSYGLQVWTDWSSRWPKFDGPEACQREWGTFGRGRRAAVTMRSYIPRGWAPGRPTPQAAFAEIAVRTVAQVPSELPAIPMREPGLPQGMRDARDGTLTTRPLTEYGNALRMYDKHGQDLRYVTNSKSWLIWDGAAWSHDPDGAAVIHMATLLAYNIYDEGAGNLHEADTYAKWARKSQELRTAKATVAVLSTIPVLRINSAMIDNDPMIVGMDMARKAVDLTAGEMRDATRGDLLTKSLGAAEVGDPAGCVRWLSFLDQIFAGDKLLIDWLQRWCGYVLTGDTREHFFCFAYGKGRNGKGTFTETLKTLMHDYANPVGLGTLTDMRRVGGNAAPDVAALAGLRLAFCSETEEDVALAEGLIKTLTGGDSIRTRQIYEKEFTFKPQFKLLVMGNHKPIIKGHDFAMWSRVKMIPFTRTYEEHEQDKSLKETLITEIPHILAWMIQGCLRWQQVGLSDTPPAVSYATEQYKEEMDWMGQWIDERCDISDPTKESAASQLYQGYKSWAQESGHNQIMTLQKFGRKMIDRGFIRKKATKCNFYIGIATKLP